MNISQIGNGGFVLELGGNQYDAELDLDNGYLTGYYNGGIFKISLLSDDPAVVSLSDDGQGGHFEPLKNEEYTKVVVLSESNFTENNNFDTFTGTIVNIEDTGLRGTWGISIRKYDSDEQLVMNYRSESPIDHLLGTKAKITYTSEEDNSIINILHDGRLLNNTSEWNDTTGYPKFSGYLEGVEYVTGDLPTKFTVVDSLGQSLLLNDFIYENMVELNNLFVTVYYRSRIALTVHEIHQIEE